MQKAEVVTEETTTDIEKFETRHPAPMPAIRTDSPMDAVMVAMEKGYSPEFIEKMMDLQERNEKNEARKAYHAAVAAFKAVAPKIKKDKFNAWFQSWHTSLGNLLDTYNPVLGKCGLSISFPTSPPAGDTLSVECKLSHELGHSESITMVAPIDKAAVGKASGQKSRNPIQDIRSTFTYLRSMTAEAVLGVAGTEGSLDDDGNGAGKPVEPVKFITIEQAQAIAKGVKQAGVDKEKFLEFHNIEKFEELTEVGLKKAQAQVARRIKENEKAENADN